jgi:microcystin-dependent protein
LATSFPTGLDALTNPTSANGLNSPDHAGQHSDANDAIEALEAKVGVNGSAVTSSLDYKITNINASNLASGTVPSARVAGAYTGVTSVGTLGSLTVTGDVTVDTNTLKVDSTNNRVGVNVTSPSVELDVLGTATVRAAATQDGVALAGRAGGTSSYEVTLTPTTLSADRILTLPNVTGTVVTTGDSGSVTSTMITDNTIVLGDLATALQAFLVPSGAINMWGTATAPTNWLLCDGAAVSRTTYATLFAVISTTYGVGDGSTTFNVPDLKGKVAVGKAASGTFLNLGASGGAETVTLTSAESGVPVHGHSNTATFTGTAASHNHTQDSHNHTQNSHNHTQNSHNHGGSVGTGEFLYRDSAYNTGFNSWVGNVYLAITWNGGTASATAVNQAQTATNIAATATNQSTSITPVGTVAMNNANNTAANASSAHNNLQPYIVLNYIIKT